MWKLELALLTYNRIHGSPNQPKFLEEDKFDWSCNLDQKFVGGNYFKSFRKNDFGWFLPPIYFSDQVEDFAFGVIQRENMDFWLLNTDTCLGMITWIFDWHFEQSAVVLATIKDYCGVRILGLQVNK